MIKFAVATLGCKVNTYESESYIQGLLDIGYQEVDFKAYADVYIINTCAVTNTAAAKSRQKIHAAKKVNPAAVVCVVGCYVQSDKSTIDLDVDILIGSSHKKELPRLIEEAILTSKKIRQVDAYDDLAEFEEIEVHSFQHKTRAFLKIQDGCNQFCSYCIIPYARGRERSLHIDKVYEQAKALATNGHKEIVLAGIHLGRYGLDKGTSLLELLKRLVTIEELDRIRISSIEITEIDDDFIAFMKQEDKIANHLHIPIQAGSDTIIKAMRRPYTLSYFKKRIQSIRSQIPTISISTDVIVGFPQESDTLFLETMDTLEHLRFSSMHVFPYSKRDGTQAATLHDHLSNQVKKDRVRLVSKLSDTHQQEYIESFMNKNVQVLFEYEKDGLYYGHTSEYIMVVCASKVKINELQYIHIVNFKEKQLIGETYEIIEHI